MIANASAEPRPLVSILMPAYNAARFIGHAIQSCLDQTYRHWELIVVDDGSTDETGSIVDRCATQDGRIVVSHTKNHGFAAAMNEAFRLCHGVMIARLDADDGQDSRRIEKQVGYLLGEHHQRPDLVSCKTLHLTEDGRLLDAPGNHDEKPNDFTTVGAWVLGWREAFESAGGWLEDESGFAVDIAWSKRALLAGNRCGAVLEPLYHYRHYPGQASEAALAARARADELIASRYGALQLRTMYNAAGDDPIVSDKRTAPAEWFPGYGALQLRTM